MGVLDISEGVLLFARDQPRPVQRGGGVEFAPAAICARLLLSAAGGALAPAEIAGRLLGLYGAVCAAALCQRRRSWHGQRFQTQNDTQPTIRCTISIHGPAQASKFFTLTARSLHPSAQVAPGGSGGLASPVVCRTADQLVHSPPAMSLTVISRGFGGGSRLLQG